MSDVIDLGQERDRRTGPDAEFVRRDDFGRPLYCFLLDYEMAGAGWSTEDWAYDAADAESRVQAMRGTLTVAGQIYTAIAGE